MYSYEYVYLNQIGKLFILHENAKHVNHYSIWGKNIQINW